jgi:beta-lactam-binding protein with PASTA domain
VLAGSLVAAFGAAMFMLTSESMLRASFAAALDSSLSASTKVADASSPISGSEDFWLTGNIQGRASSPSKAVNVGDKISLNIGGEKRTLQVSKISEYRPQVTEIDTTGNASRFVMITARDTTDPSSRPIRLVIELEQDGATIAKDRGRAL